MGRSQRISAGTSILVDKAIAPLVKEHEILMEGQAQFITFQSPDNGSLTIVNVYAQRSSNNKAPFWRKLTQAEFTSDHIIVGGDFNHLEELIVEVPLAKDKCSRERQLLAPHDISIRTG